MFPAATNDIVNGLAEAGATGTANRSTAVSTAIAILCSQSRVFNRRFISYSAESHMVPQQKCSCLFNEFTLVVHLSLLPAPNSQRSEPH